MHISVHKRAFVVFFEISISFSLKACLSKVNE